MTDDKNRISVVLWDSLKQYKNRFALVLLIEIANVAVFWLYSLSLEPFLYTAVLVQVLTLLAFLVFFLRQMKRSRTRQPILASPETEWQNLPEPVTLEEEEMQAMIRQLGKKAETLADAFNNDKQDMMDYYIAWVHQIKTPIAVMRLQLSSEDTDANRSLLTELFRIEQYVDMVLQYMRLGSNTTDLLIEEYELDSLIRESIRKYASSFIQKRLQVEFQPTGRTIVTDKKWFCLILEQFLSNAIKYTQIGKITIFADERERLCITDTGIGIAEEDLPRIFDKGFTGRNGRIGQKSSGLGLYLAKKAADLLRIPVGVESRQGEGSIFYLKIDQS